MKRILLCCALVLLATSRVHEDSNEVGGSGGVRRSEEDGSEQQRHQQQAQEQEQEQEQEEQGQDQRLVADSVEVGRGPNHIEPESDAGVDDGAAEQAAMEAVDPKAAQEERDAQEEEEDLRDIGHDKQLDALEDALKGDSQENDDLDAASNDLSDLADRASDGEGSGDNKRDASDQQGSEVGGVHSLNRARANANADTQTGQTSAPTSAPGGTTASTTSSGTGGSGTTATGTTSPSSSSSSSSSGSSGLDFPLDQLWKRELLEDLLADFPGFDIVPEWYHGVLFPYTVTGDLLWNVQYGCAQVWRSMTPLIYRDEKEVLALRNEQVARAMVLQAMQWLRLADKFRHKCARKTKFYLGLVSSMLLDSYAPAHVVRDDDGCGHIWQFQAFQAQDKELHEEADKKFHHKEYPGVWKCAKKAVAQIIRAHERKKSVRVYRTLLNSFLRVAPQRARMTSGGSVDLFVPRAVLHTHYHQRHHRHHHHFLETAGSKMGHHHLSHLHSHALTTSHHHRESGARHHLRQQQQQQQRHQQQHHHFHHRFALLETVARAKVSDANTAVTTSTNTNTNTEEWIGVHHFGHYGWNRIGGWTGWHAPVSFFHSAPVVSPTSLVPVPVSIHHTLFGNRLKHYFMLDSESEEPEYVADSELELPALCIAQEGPITTKIITTWHHELTASIHDCGCDLPVLVN